MGYLIAGIIFVVLPIITWFSGEGFVPIAGATLFFWLIGIPMIIVGADKVTPGGIWAPKKRPNSRPPKGHFARTYQFDDDGKITGAPIEQWVKD